MNLRLTRTDFLKEGVFGELVDEEGTVVAQTLEHAYPGYGPASEFVPKVSVGTYRCIRHAPNRLPYETFLLENVPDFEGKPVSGILFHRGNFDKDSEGCILLGDRRLKMLGQLAVTNSRDAFARFMALVDGLDSFNLTIS